MIKKMNNFVRTAANSSPELSPLSSPTNLNGTAHSSLILQGLAANVKLLLKLIEDHNEACTKNYDGRKLQRVASMITIIDEVKSRIQKSQSFNNRRNAALRRCNTELRAHQVQHRDQSRQSNETAGSSSSTSDEKELLRKELSASFAARKSLERMFSSLGKEKEIMTSELARKVHELNGIEEHVNDLKVQNAMLLAKIQACALEHQIENGTCTQEDDTNGMLEECNTEISEQLFASLDGFKSLERRLEHALEEKEDAHVKMVEIDEQSKLGLNHIAYLRKRLSKEQTGNVEDELSALEGIFKSFEKFA